MLQGSVRILWRGVVVPWEQMNQSDWRAEQANLSADYMALERDQRLADLGQPPLSARMKAENRTSSDRVDVLDSTGHRRIVGDANTSQRQLSDDINFAEDWLESNHPGRGALVTGLIFPDTRLSPDDISFYGPDRRAEWDERALELSIRAKERAAIADLPANTPISELVRISQQTLTDPVGAALIQQAEITLVPTATPLRSAPTTPLQTLLDRLGIDQLALPPLRVPSEVPAHFDQPSGPENVLTPAQLAARESRMVLGKMDPLFLAAPISEIQARQQEADVLYFWRDNYPKVELLAADNPRIPPALLTQVFPQGLKSRFKPPLVRVKVTPRKMPKPDAGLLGDIAPFVSPILSFIPAVGGIASTAFKIVVAGHMADVYGDVQIPISAFAPQYSPRPFWVTLPVDQAQTAVAQPWFVPAIYSNFAREQSRIVAAAYA